MPLMCTGRLKSFSIGLLLSSFSLALTLGCCEVAVRILQRLDRLPTYSGHTLAPPNAELNARLVRSENPILCLSGLLSSVTGSDTGRK